MQWLFDALEAVALGLIQGLTEFIPISSSGHLVIAQYFLSGASDHLFLEFINLGTLVALLVFFRGRIKQLFIDVFQKHNYRLARNILISIIPAGIIGFVFADFIETAPFFGSPFVVVFTLAIVGLLMVLIEKLPHASFVKDGEQLSGGKALIIGLAQAVALVPGVSRSGATILAGRFSGLKSAEAAEYSFLVSIPIMFGVTLKILLTDSDYLLNNIATLALSNLAAFISGWLAVGFLMRFLSKHSLAFFGWYRIGLAAILVVVLLLQ